MDDRGFFEGMPGMMSLLGLGVGRGALEKRKEKDYEL